MSVRQAIGDILQAVRAGEEERLRHLLEGFATVADVEALFLLRRSLSQDLLRD